MNEVELSWAAADIAIARMQTIRTKRIRILSADLSENFIYNSKLHVKNIDV